MPQLYPMNWMILLIMFSLVYLMIFTIIYFFPMNFPINFPKKKNSAFFYFKW